MDNTEIVERVHKLEQNEAVQDEKIEVANHRIDDLEEEVKENRELTIAVKEIATEMKHLREEQTSMRKEQENMNNRIKVIEEKPIKDYEETKKQIKTNIISFVSGIILTALAVGLGLSKFL